MGEIFYKDAPRDVFTKGSFDVPLDVEEKDLYMGHLHPSSAARVCRALEAHVAQVLDDCRGEAQVQV